MKKQLADLTLYKWRYILGYGTLALLFVASVAVASVYAPGGLTQLEIDSLRVTNDLASGNLNVTNLPFHLLQLASLSIFGVSIFTIKLPAIALSVIAAVAIFSLLRRWFKPNIAILSMLIMTVTGQFIFVAQNATSQILYIAYSALILLFASLIIQKAKKQLLWKIGLGVSVALSLYTPYFIYINTVLLVVALAHPHTRYHLFRRGQRKNWLIAGLIMLALVSPLVYLSMLSPSLLTETLGYKAIESGIIANLKLLLFTYFWVTPLIDHGQILPIMDFSALMLIILGGLMLFRQRHLARTYMIVAWLATTTLVLIFQPSLTTAVTLPLFILLAIGVETLLGEWYKIFPNNPYARSMGLFLMIALISVMIFSGADRFTYGYRYMPDAVGQYNVDLPLIKRELAKKPVPTFVLVDESERPIYDALSRKTANRLEVSVEPETEIGTAIVTRKSLDRAPNDWQLQTIITNDRFEAGNRLYVFKTGQK